MGAFSLMRENVYGFLVMCAVLIINVYGYFRQGTVYLAFKQLRTGDHVKATETLALTKRVNWLSKTQQAYYHFVKGYLEMAKGHVDTAKEAFLESVNIGLRIQNDQAMAYANLATLYHRTKNKVKAREFLAKTNSLKVKKQTKKELERLDAMIN